MIQLTPLQQSELAKASEAWFIGQVIDRALPYIPSLKADQFRQHARQSFRDCPQLLDIAPAEAATWLCCIYCERLNQNTIDFELMGENSLFEVATQNGFGAPLFKAFHEAFGQLQSIGLPICNQIASPFGYAVWLLKSRVAKLPVAQVFIQRHMLRHDQWQVVGFPLSVSVSDGVLPVGCEPELTALAEGDEFVGLELLFDQKSIHLDQVESLQAIVHSWLKQVQINQMDHDALSPSCANMKLLAYSPWVQSFSKHFWSIEVHDTNSHFIQANWSKKELQVASCMVQTLPALKPAKTIFSKPLKSEFKVFSDQPDERVCSVIWSDQSDRLAGTLGASWGWFTPESSDLSTPKWSVQALIDLDIKPCSFDLSFSISDEGVLTSYVCEPVFPDRWFEQVTLTKNDLSELENSPLRLATLTGPIVTKFSNQNDPAGGLSMPSSLQAGYWSLVLAMEYSPKLKRFIVTLSMNVSDLVVGIHKRCPWLGVSYEVYDLAAAQTLWSWRVNE